MYQLFIGRGGGEPGLVDLATGPAARLIKGVQSDIFSLIDRSAVPNPHDAKIEIFYYCLATHYQISLHD